MNVHDMGAAAPEPALLGPDLRGSYLPDWFDERRPLAGAPAFVWRRLTETLSPEAMADLRRQPALLKLALVLTWRQWRRQCIAAEWRR